MMSAQPVPLQGSVEAVERYTINPPTMLVDTTGSGNATQLEQFTVTWQFTVNLDTGEGVGSACFTAANGDSLDTTSRGQGDPTATPDVNRVLETHTITGGTGGFAGATGTFTLERLVNMKTGVTSGSFDGSIVLQNERKFEPMAIIQIHELPGMTREQYEQALRELNLAGPPPGSQLHAGGPMEGGWRIVEVWESAEAADRFYGSDLFQQMVRSTGIPAPTITSYPIETVRM